MHIEKLSLYIITLNEERRLGAVLESAKGLVDEIVVVDSGSTDRTEEIANAYGARFLFHKWESVGHQVKWAEEQCTYRWVLRLDADEVVSPELAEEIREIRKNGTKDGYMIRFGDMFPGMKHVNPWVKPLKKIALYCRDAWTMSGEMNHDAVVKVRPDATCGRCRQFVEHYSFISICKFKSSSVGNFSKISFEIYLLSSNEDIPIGTLILFNDHFAVNLSLFLQSNNPIV